MPFCYSRTPDNKRHLYKEDICLLYEKYNLNEKAINIVKSFHLKFKAKHLIREGQECKERLMSKLSNQTFQFQLTVNFFLQFLDT